MLFVAVLCVVAVQCQALENAHPGGSEEFNDVLAEGLHVVRSLLQNTETNLPSAVNKAFDCEYRLITLALAPIFLYIPPFLKICPSNPLPPHFVDFKLIQRVISPF